jgi:Tfp pilus assembly PilM family ATPase
MIGPQSKGRWVGIVCDGGSATLVAVQGVGSDARIIAQRQIEVGFQELHRRGQIPALASFVTESHLAGCDVYVAFTGSAAVVQRLTMPPLSRRDRHRAVQTRLTSYADGRELVVDLALDPRAPGRKGVRLLAGGADRSLVRGLHRACQRAGLRARTVTALASAFGPPTDGGTAMQLILGERTSTIQLFDAGRLITCRDVLLGRADFLQAYQRPILAKDGPVTLSPEQADALARRVGVPVGREDEVHPGVSATQLWPTLNPVLQKLLYEVEQSLTHSELKAPRDARLSVLGLPTLPGLDEFLVSELQLQGSLVAPAHAEAHYLAALSGHSAGGTPLDLRPPEQRFAERLTRPALAAGICALLIVLANSFSPQPAQAHLGQLRPLTGQLQAQLIRAQQERIKAKAARDELATQLRRDRRLLEVAPAQTPLVGALKLVFSSRPPTMQVLGVQINAGETPATLDLRAAYQGAIAASVVADQWARALLDSALFSEAKVTAVSGSGHGDPAVVEIQATLAGG